MIRTLIPFLVLAFIQSTIPCHAQTDSTKATLPPEKKTFDMYNNEIGLSYCWLNDLSLSYNTSMTRELSLQLDASGYMSQRGTVNEYRYRFAGQLQLNIAREQMLRGYVGVGVHYMRRPNRLYTDYGYYNSDTTYRTNLEPFVSVGGEVPIVSRFTISVALNFDSFTIERPENLYLIFYEPFLYPGFELGAHFTF